MFRAISRFFLSLYTTFGVFVAFIALAVTGSLSLVGNLAFFSGIDDSPLFQWLGDAGSYRTTWWISAMIILLAVLAVNTVFCTADALVRRTGRLSVAVSLSPQVMHIGVLLIMLGHLLTAALGFRTDVLVGQGEERTVSGAASIFVSDVRVTTDADGYATDWGAMIRWRDEKGPRTEELLRPVHPLYFGQFGLYMKTAAVEPSRTALIRVCRDPGAPWALIGGILLSLGGIGFLYGRFSVPSR